VRVEVTEDGVEVLLAPWQKVLGLMRDIRLPFDQIEEVEIVENPVGEAMRAGIKVGLRIPWLYFVARTIRLDQAFVVRRGVPALSIQVSGHGALARVLVSNPRASELAERIERLRVAARASA
jgi:hypothetical protein